MIKVQPIITGEVTLNSQNQVNRQVDLLDKISTSLFTSKYEYVHN